MQLINEALIEKYLKGLCTAEEAVVVSEFLRDNPEHPYLIREWESTNAETALPDNYTQQMFDEVNVVISKPSGRSFLLWKVVAAAACVTGIIALVPMLNKKTVVPQTLVRTTSFTSNKMVRSTQQGRKREQPGIDRWIKINIVAGCYCTLPRGL